MLFSVSPFHTPIAFLAKDRRIDFTSGHIKNTFQIKLATK